MRKETGYYLHERYGEPVRASEEILRQVDEYNWWLVAWFKQWDGYIPYTGIYPWDNYTELFNHMLIFEMSNYDHIQRSEYRMHRRMLDGLFNRTKHQLTDWISDCRVVFMEYLAFQAMRLWCETPFPVNLTLIPGGVNPAFCLWFMMGNAGLLKYDNKWYQQKNRDKARSEVEMVMMNIDNWFNEPQMFDYQYPFLQGWEHYVDFDTLHKFDEFVALEDTIEEFVRLHCIKDYDLPQDRILYYPYHIDVINPRHRRKDMNEQFTTALAYGKDDYDVNVWWWYKDYTHYYTGVPIQMHEDGMRLVRETTVSGHKLFYVRPCMQSEVSAYYGDEHAELRKLNRNRYGYEDQVMDFDENKEYLALYSVEKNDKKGDKNDKKRQKYVIFDRKGDKNCHQNVIFGASEPQKRHKNDIVVEKYVDFRHIKSEILQIWGKNDIEKNRVCPTFWHFSEKFWKN